MNKKGFFAKSTHFCCSSRSPFAFHMTCITGRIKFDAHGDRTGSVVVIYKVVEEGGQRFFRQMKF